MKLNLNRWDGKNDYQYLIEKYRNYCIIDNIPGLDYVYQHGLYYKNLWLWPLENYITMKDFFDKDYIIRNNFRGYISSNRKMVEFLKPDFQNTYYIEYAFLNDEYHQLSKFVSFKEKIKGIACLNRIYDAKDSTYGDIIYLRKEMMSNLSSKFIKHVYSREPWESVENNVFYQNIGTDPYSVSSLEIRNRYMFNLCLETIYHNFQSWDWITERLWNTFKSKSVPIYLGCYNIEQHVPTEFFIDLRKYITTETPKLTFDYDRLNNDLEELMNNKKRYITITEEAFEWQKKNQFGKFERVEREIDTIVGYKNE